MRKIPPLSCVLAVCLLAGLVYFGYQAATTALRYAKVNDLQQRWFSNDQPPGPGQIERALAEVENALGQYGGIQLKALKAELLIYMAWYFPEDSVKPIREALPLSFEVYRDNDDNTGYAGWQVAWCLAYADLPLRLESWVDEVGIRAPYLRPQLAALLIEEKLVQDDLASIKPFISNELSERHNSVGAKVAAIAGLYMLGDVEAAAELEPSLEEISSLDANQLLVLVHLNIETLHFAQARRLLERVEERLPGDAEVAGLHALVELALDGENSGPVGQWLDKAASSTRYPRTLAGVTARAYSRLAILTGEQKWRELLLAITEQQPDDYDVQAAELMLRLHLAEEEGLLSVQHDPATEIAEVVNQAQSVLSLAESAGQRQEACFMLAYTQVLAADAISDVGDDAAAQAYLADASSSLRRGLGDPAAVDAVLTERLPEYGEFLVNEIVQSARKRWPEFDRNVHECVIDYLNRRVDLFSDIEELQPLEPLPYETGTPVPQPTQPQSPQEV